MKMIIFCRKTTNACSCLSDEGEAKFWIEPEILLARSYGLSAKALNTIQKIIEEREDEIREHWTRHFGN